MIFGQEETCENEIHQGHRQRSGADITVIRHHDQDFISPTGMVRNFDGGSALIERWLKNEDTVLFLGVWEQLNNRDLNTPEFEGIKNVAGSNSVYLSVKK